MFFNNKKLKKQNALEKLAILKKNVELANINVELAKENIELKKALEEAIQEIDRLRKERIEDLTTQSSYLGKILHFQGKLANAEKLNDDFTQQFIDPQL